MLEILLYALLTALASKSNGGKLDKDAAAGIAYGLHGNKIDGNISDLGATLGAMGVFDDK